MAQHRTFALLYSVALIDMAASALTFALTPSRVIALGGDAKTVGMLSGFVGALQLVAGPIVGRYSDRVADRRWILILGLVASALGSEVAVQAEDPIYFFLSRVPAGLFAHTLNQLRAVRHLNSSSVRSCTNCHLRAACRTEQAVVLTSAVGD